MRGGAGRGRVLPPTAPFARNSFWRRRRGRHAQLWTTRSCRICRAGSDPVEPTAGPGRMDQSIVQCASLLVESGRGMLARVGLTQSHGASCHGAVRPRHIACRDLIRRVRHIMIPRDAGRHIRSRRFRSRHIEPCFDARSPIMRIQTGRAMPAGPGWFGSGQAGPGREGPGRVVPGIRGEVAPGIGPPRRRPTRT